MGREKFMFGPINLKWVKKYLQGKGEQIWKKRRKKKK